MGRALAARLPECGPPPAAAKDARPVAGAVLPANTIVLSVTDQGGVQVVQGWVAADPFDARAEVARRTDVKILSRDQETGEAEIEVIHARRRTHLTLKVACRSGSRLAAIISPA